MMSKSPDERIFTLRYCFKRLVALNSHVATLMNCKALPETALQFLGMKTRI